MPTATISDEVCFDVEVSCSFSRFDPGRFTGPPEHCYPPEGGELLAFVMRLPDGRELNEGDARKLLGDERTDELIDMAREDAQLALEERDV